MNQWETTPYGILRFLPNPYYHPSNDPAKEKPADYYFSLMPAKKAADQILDQVNISPSSKQSTVIDLSIQGEVPKRGEDILNELLKVYNAGGHP